MTLQLRSIMQSFLIHSLAVCFVLAAGLVIPKNRAATFDLNLGDLIPNAAGPAPAPAPVQREEKLVTPVEKSEEAVPIKQDIAQDIPAPASPPAVNAGAVEIARSEYIEEHYGHIRNKILKRMTYPLVARKMGWVGRVVLSFIVREDGDVEDIRVAESSGFPVLDQSAVDAVRRSCPLPNPRARVELSMPVQYLLK